MRPEQETSELQFLVDPRVYPLEVIYRVCYQFTDKYYLWLERRKSGEICVHITPKAEELIPVHVQGSFGNALIDYAVRWSVARETRDIRATIVSTALAEAHRGPPHEGRR
jgi:His-Xaa-Ser system protein HxsD